MLRNIEHLQGKCLNTIQFVCKFKYCDTGALVSCAGRDLLSSCQALLLCYKWFCSFYTLFSALVSEVCYY